MFLLSVVLLEPDEGNNRGNLLLGLWRGTRTGIGMGIGTVTGAMLDAPLLLQLQQLVLLSPSTDAFGVWSLA